MSQDLLANSNRARTALIAVKRTVLELLRESNFSQREYLHRLYDRICEKLGDDKNYRMDALEAIVEEARKCLRNKGEKK